MTRFLCSGTSGTPLGYLGGAHGFQGRKYPKAVVGAQSSISKSKFHNIKKFILWHPLGGPRSALGTTRYRGHLLNLGSSFTIQNFGLTRFRSNSPHNGVNFKSISIALMFTSNTFSIDVDFR